MLSREAANTNSIVFDLAIKPLMWLNINGTHDFFRIKEVGYNFFLIWFTAHRYMHCFFKINDENNTIFNTIMKKKKNTHLCYICNNMHNG
jgi:hypothetical protein